MVLPPSYSTVGKTFSDVQVNANFSDVTSLKLPLANKTGFTVNNAVSYELQSASPQDFSFSSWG